MTSAGCAPLLTMYTAVVKTKPSRWTPIEPDFLKAMWAFDQNLALGIANQGDNQNGKGDFFTDVIALLLENCSGKSLHGRGSVPGLVFRNHALDASYPATGTLEVLLETKILGAPITDRNKTSQKNLLGRPGSADIDKRVKEAAFKTIDLKAEWARTAGAGGGPTGDLTRWLRRSRPSCYLFVAVRITDDSDLRRVLATANAAKEMMDDVGVVAYRPDLTLKQYMPQPVGTQLELDRVLAKVCTDLRSLP